MRKEIRRRGHGTEKMWIDGEVIDPDGKWKMVGWDMEVMSHPPIHNMSVQPAGLPYLPGSTC